MQLHSVQFGHEALSIVAKLPAFGRIVADIDKPRAQVACDVRLIWIGAIFAKQAIRAFVRECGEMQQCAVPIPLARRAARFGGNLGIRTIKCGESCKVKLHAASMTSGINTGIAIFEREISCTPVNRRIVLQALQCSPEIGINDPILLVQMENMLRRMFTVALDEAKPDGTGK